MIKFKIETFIKGLVTSIEAKSIPDGAASRNINWLTEGDRIALRRGTLLTGTENTGSGEITGLYVAKKPDGTEIPFRTRGKKLEYYNTTTSDWVEIGSDLLGTDADGEDVAFAEYVSNAGNQLWLSSPNSSLYKIMTANPASYTDMYDDAKNYKGKLRIKFNRMLMWGRNEDKTGLYGSHVDEQNFTTISDEVIGTGDGSTSLFSNTLTFKAAGAKRTCFGIVVTDGTETFTDDYNGVLTGSLGGTGTINYTTGEISVTFNSDVTNLQDVTCTYQWEDSTNGGIADFTESGTRLAGEGFIFRQDDGGADLQNIFSYKDVEYCSHKYKTWRLELTTDDTNASNLPYRENLGIPNWKAGYESGEGIYVIDDSDSKDPRFRLIQYEVGSTEVIPASISNDLDLSDYRFDKSAVFGWGDFVMFSCRHKDSTKNNVVFLYNKLWKSWDKMEQYVSTFSIYNGTLLAGDSLSDNVYVLFSGFDDDESLINNLYETNESSLSTLFAQTKETDSRLKKVKSLVLNGLISKDQKFNVYANYDNSGYVLVDTIEGTGSYVDAGQAISVGATTIGSREIGGGSDGVNAYNYKHKLSLRSDRFEKVKLKFEAIGIGYLSISAYIFHDIRVKSTRLPYKYR